MIRISNSLITNKYSLVCMGFTTIIANKYMLIIILSETEFSIPSNVGTVR